VTRLLVTRGLPGSGKTTYARSWVSVYPVSRARVNRDDIREMLNESVFVKGATEQRVQAVRDATIRTLLERGVDVICDDTNLPQRTVRDLSKLAHFAKAEVEFIDFTHVTLDTCLDRNLRRTDKPPVPESAIIDLHRRYLRGNLLPLPDPLEEAVEEEFGLGWYSPDPDLPAAVIADIDGTVALKGDRDAYDETRVHEDRPHIPVIESLQDARAAGKVVIFLSGRTMGCELATKMWLDRHTGLDYAGPFMRPVGDNRKDAIVKRELFDTHVRPFYNVRCVYDDRNQVVDMWRALGLQVNQVAPGDF
jgi:predicted kinase